MKHSIEVYVGQRVRQRRWVVGMTLQQLGDRVGITAQQIMKIEAGTYEINASLMRDIAAALEVPALSFFEGVELALGDAA
jgi:transcriptional regulator with XRE-family HTH domain